MEEEYLAVLGSLQKVSGNDLRLMMRSFGDLECFLRAKLGDFLEIGLNPKAAQEVVAQREKIDPDIVWKKLQEIKARIITEESQEYPARLREISSPPVFLYIRGRLLPEDDLSFAVVGTRLITEYGRRVVEEIVGGLAQAGLSIVSGMAFGIDTEVHKITLARDGRTIAVLGCGLDYLYPPANASLGRRIIESGGAVISEYASGVPPLKQHFPARNRIISGMTRGTLVVEAGERSGALITARFALDQNREVFAIPGDIFREKSQGPNNLIKSGAYPVTRAEDILEILNIRTLKSSVKVRKVIPANKTEEEILCVLGEDPRHIDEICRVLKKLTQEVSTQLSVMEMKGMVKNVGGMRYVKN